MAVMSPRERVIAALKHQRPDKVPCEVRCTIDMQAEMAEYAGRDYVGKYIEPIIARVELEDPGTWVKPGYYKDVFGVVWNRTLDKNYGVVENSIVSPDNFKDYRFPEPLSDEYLAGCKKTFVNCGGLYRLGRLNLSLWERAWTMRGMENLYMDLAADPTFAHELFCKICDYNCLVLERAFKNLEFDGVHFGDDWGTQAGLQMSAGMWREFIKPYIKRMYGMVRDAGKFVSIHSCGKVQELFDDLIEVGVNSFNPFQPEVIDVDWAVSTYGKRLCFWGGISTQVTLSFGTTQDVYAQTKHLLEMGRAGGMIVTPAHSIPPGTNPKNIIAMLEAMRDHC